MKKKATIAVSPDDYVTGLSGWRRALVSEIRETVRRSADLRETIKWGHLVYYANGPVLLIRAESERVLFGFWRGQRLRDIEPRLRPGGKYEMATAEFREGDALSAEVAANLVTAAVELNLELGDPTGRQSSSSSSATPAVRAS